MIIISGDEKKIVDIGSEDIILSLYSTMMVRVKDIESNMPNTLLFLRKKKCPVEKAIETARQFNLLRDALAKVKPNEIIYDYNDLNKQPPWGNNISPVITSAANYYTTADGKDLLFEIVNILVHGGIQKTDIFIR